MTVDPVLASLLGGAVGSVVTGAFLLGSQWITKRAEDRRHRRELAIKAAIANWEGTAEIWKVMQEKDTKSTLPPLDHFIIHMLNLTELIEHKTLTVENIGQELLRIKQLTRAANAAAQEEHLNA